MTKSFSFTAAHAGFMAGATFMAVLTGSAADNSAQRNGLRPRMVAQLQITVGFQDDYDYYPQYETYYSRNRHEFVYFDDGVWVRRPAPRGVSIDVFFAAPAIRMDFHDSPELHHRDVIRHYPRNWKREERERDDRDEQRRNDKDGHHDERKDDRRDGDRK
jgi:hypothetical protein